MNRIIKSVKEKFNVDIETESIKNCIVKLENLSKQRDISFSEEAVELSITISELLSCGITKSVELSTFIVNEIKRLSDVNSPEESYTERLNWYTLHATEKDVKTLSKLIKESEEKFSEEFIQIITKLYDVVKGDD